MEFGVLFGAATGYHSAKEAMVSGGQGRGKAGK